MRPFRQWLRPIQSRLTTLTPGQASQKQSPVLPVTPERLEFPIAKPTRSNTHPGGGAEPQ